MREILQELLIAKFDAIFFGDDRQLAVACNNDGDLDDAEDTPAGLASLYDNYLKRKLELEDVPLYTLASRFTDKCIAIDDHLKWRFPHVVPYRSPKRDQDPEDYELNARDRLRLFVPHRDDDALRGSCSTFCEALHAFILSTACPAPVRREVEMWDAKAEAEERSDDDEDDLDEEVIDDDERRRRMIAMKTRDSEAFMCAPVDDDTDMCADDSAALDHGGDAYWNDQYYDALNAVDERLLSVFDKYTGPPFLADVPNSVWIPVFTARWKVKGKHYSRTMLPLILGWAITIHKSQGTTIGKGSAIAEKVFISIGNNEYRSGMSYTAFSRAKTRGDYAVQFPVFGLARLTRIKTHKQFQARIIEDARLEQLAKKTIMKFRHLDPGLSYHATPYDPCNPFSHCHMANTIRFCLCTANHNHASM